MHTEYKYDTISAFSLVELMVVVAIIGILTTIAVPAYKQYIIKARIATAIPILQDYSAEVKQHWQAGPPEMNNITFLGATTTDDAPVQPVSGAFPVVGIEFDGFDSVYNGLHNNSFAVCVYIAGLEGMDTTGGAAYVDPALGMPGSRDRLCMLTLTSGSTFTDYCGIFSPTDESSLPEAYLPTGCTCNNFYNNTCN